MHIEKIENFSLDASQQVALSLLFSYQKEIESSNMITDLLTAKNKKRGVYLWGEVGRGKSMLMRQFFNAVASEKKHWDHFHNFMLTLHNAMHQMRSGEQKTSKKDFLLNYADAISKQYRALFLDELQINNIADAMLVGRLFKQLMKNGTLIFFTSNRLPSDLFKDGIQRESFLPFIDLVNERLSVFHLDNHIDYRLEAAKQSIQYYYQPITQLAQQELNSLAHCISGKKNLPDITLSISKDRAVHLEKAWGSFADCTFQELCQQNLGAADYLKIAETFHTMIIRNIPELTEEQPNEALRFITLIDCLYEHKTKVIFLANTTPDKIYASGKHSFEFQRTVSRINEMTSLEYWEGAREIVCAYACD